MFVIMTWACFPCIHRGISAQLQQTKRQVHAIPVLLPASASTRPRSYLVFYGVGRGGGGCTSAELLSSASADSYHFWSYLLVAPAREAKMDALAICWWAKIKLLCLTVCSKVDSFCYLQVCLRNTYNPSDAVQAWDSVAGLPLVVNSFCECERRKDLYAACVGKAVI